MLDESKKINNVSLIDRLALLYDRGPDCIERYSATIPFRDDGLKIIDFSSDPLPTLNRAKSWTIDKSLGKKILFNDLPEKAKIYLKEELKIIYSLNEKKDTDNSPEKINQSLFVSDCV